MDNPHSSLQSTSFQPTALKDPPSSPNPPRHPLRRLALIMNVRKLLLARPVASEASHRPTDSALDSIRDAATEVTELALSLLLLASLLLALPAVWFQLPSVRSDESFVTPKLVAVNGPALTALCERSDSSEALSLRASPLFCPHGGGVSLRRVSRESCVKTKSKAGKRSRKLLGELT